MANSARKALLVDTNFSAGPIYQFLLESGLDVTVVGGNPGDALAKSCGDYVQLDYSDSEKLQQFIKERRFDFLVPGCNDLSYSICSQLNESGAFPGLDSSSVTQTINDKQKFRLFARQNNLPSPSLLLEGEYETRWPVIIKPVDAFSGRGVTVVRETNKGDFSQAVSQAQDVSRTGRFVVEDYVEGQLYSHSAFIQNAKVVADFVVEEHGSANPFVVDTSCVRWDFSLEMLGRIRNNIEVMAQALFLCDGLVHTQFMCKNDQYWLIEVTRRCPGDLYSQLISLSTGFDYAANYARPFLGVCVDLSAARDQYPRFVMRHTLSQPSTSKLDFLGFRTPLNIVRWIPIASTGDRLRASPHGRIALLFAEASDRSDLSNLMSLALSRDLYDVRSW